MKEAASSGVDRRQGFRFADLVDLTKPRITFMVLLTAGIGAVMASPGLPPLDLALYALAGTWLVAAGSAALNHVLEREVDGLMRRTANRPLPAGRLRPAAAVAFGSALGLAGLAILAWRVNLLTAGLGVVAFVGYVWIYTPLKPRSSLATLVGAVPGAIPPVMGWTATSGSLDPGAAALFGILFLWQLPHFLAIAWLCREDYARAGFPMLSVLHPDGRSTARQMFLYAAALLPVSLVPAVLGLVDRAYFAGALLLGLGFLLACASFTRGHTERAARRVLLASVLYLPALLGVMLLDRAS